MLVLCSCGVSIVNIEAITLEGELAEERLKRQRLLHAVRGWLDCPNELTKESLHKEVIRQSLHTHMGYAGLDLDLEGRR